MYRFFTNPMFGPAAASKTDVFWRLTQSSTTRSRQSCCPAQRHCRRRRLGDKLWPCTCLVPAQVQSRRRNCRRSAQSQVTKCE